MRHDFLNGLAEPLGLKSADRELLQVAALLQDVGYLINYKQHHKHSYQLIVNSQLPGFRRQELEIIANLARYHRGARPKKKHSNFGQLSKQDQNRVKRLAAILRIAGGLDRGHAQRIQLIEAQALEDRVILRVTAKQDPDLELWSARGRSDLFERVFGRQAIIQAENAPAAPEPLT